MAIDQSTSSTSSSSNSSDVLTQIIGEIESIVSVLGERSIGSKELQSQLSGFKTQITSLEKHVKKKQCKSDKISHNEPDLEFSLTNL